MEIFFRYLSSMLGDLVGENVHSHIYMRQKQKKLCRKRSTLDLVMKKVRINTHLDSIHVNTPTGLSYICKLIGQLFGVGLRKNFPPVPVKDQDDLISLGLEQFFRQAPNRAEEEESTNELIGAYFLYNNSLFSVERFITPAKRVRAVPAANNADSDDISLDLIIGTATQLVNEYN